VNNALSQKDWIAEGHVISTTNGADLYAKYCASCHGKQGKGDGAGALNLPSGLPAFAPNMQTPYVFGRVWNGVPENTMPPFQWLLAESDIWDITSYVGTLPGQGGGK
jgi:mono/diheme cytochrome c family protein